MRVPSTVSNDATVLTYSCESEYVKKHKKTHKLIITGRCIIYD